MEVILDFLLIFQIIWFFRWGRIQVLLDKCQGMFAKVLKLCGQFRDNSETMWTIQDFTLNKQFLCGMEQMSTSTYLDFTGERESDVVLLDKLKNFSLTFRFLVCKLVTRETYDPESLIVILLV